MQWKFYGGFFQSLQTKRIELHTTRSITQQASKFADSNRFQRETKAYEKGFGNEPICESEFSSI